MAIKDWFELQLWKIARNRLIKGFGCNCATVDTDDFPGHDKHLNAPGRCPSCAAKEVVQWIDAYMRLLK